MNAPEHIKCAELIMDTWDDGLGKADRVSIREILLVAQTHALLAQVEILSAIYERMAPPQVVDSGPKLCGRDMGSGVICNLPDDHTDAHKWLATA